MSKIEQILPNAEFRTTALMRMRLAWLANTRPNILLEISQIAQLTRSMYEKDMSTHCKRLKKLIKYLHDQKAPTRIPKLDYDSLRMTAYSDASISNNAGLSSRPGRIILLINDSHNAISVSYKS